jgi:hypothetical protein
MQLKRSLVTTTTGWDELAMPGEKLRLAQLKWIDRGDWFVNGSEENVDPC